MVAPKYDENVIVNVPAPLAARGAASRRDVSSLNGRERVGLQLAHRYGITAVEALAMVRYAGSRGDGREHLSVASRSDVNTRYTVVYDPAADVVIGCDCPAHGPCWHLGAARMRVELWHYQAAREEPYREDWDAKDYLLMHDYERAHGEE